MRRVQVVLSVIAVTLLLAITAYCQTDISSQLTFTTIDVPGAATTSVTAINTAGEMVGSYSDSTNGPAHGFIFNNGVFTFFDYPGAQSTIPLGLNDSGQIVGVITQGGLAENGFTYDGTQFAVVKDGANQVTIAWGANNQGVIVGGAGTPYTTKGFQLLGSRFRNISPPGVYVYVYATGINNFGQVVGWTDSDGFSYKNGKFRTIDVPNATQTQARGVNDNGLIVGWYTIPGPLTNAFVLIHGQYLSVSYPGAAGTSAGGINSLGQIVGAYTFDFNTYHGFVTSSVQDTSKK